MIYPHRPDLAHKWFYGCPQALLKQLEHLCAELDNPEADDTEKCT